MKYHENLLEREEQFQKNKNTNFFVGKNDDRQF